MSESSARLFPAIVSFCASYVIHINVDPMISFDKKWDACTSYGDMQKDRLMIHFREQYRIKLNICIILI